MPDSNSYEGTARRASHMAPAGAPASARASQPARVRTSDAPGTSSTAPRPIDSNAAAALPTLEAGEGAVVATRDNAADAAEAAIASRHATGAKKRMSAKARPHVERAEQDVEINPALVAGIAVAALAVIALVAFLVSRALSSAPAPQDPNAPGEPQIERTTVTSDDAIDYDGYTYAFRQDPGGAYALVRTAESGEPLSLMQLSGTPVEIVLYDGAFVIPENLADGTWDIMAYSLADGSMSSQLVNADGAPVTGEGVISAATLDGTDLVLELEGGGQQRIPLVF